MTKKNVLPYKKAIESGALAFFDEKYDDTVRVVNIGRDSVELCGGTHVNNTSEIGSFKIISQSSVANGVRRLECVTGQNAFDYMNNKISTLDKICREFQTTPDNIVNKINSIKDEVKLLKKKNLLYSKDFLTNLFNSFNKVTLKKTSYIT